MGILHDFGQFINQHPVQLIVNIVVFVGLFAAFVHELIKEPKRND